MPTTLSNTGITFNDATVQTTAASGSFILLGTLTTTSGTTQTLSGLSLSSYQYLYIAIAGVSFTAGANLRLGETGGTQFRIAPVWAAANLLSGWATVSLRGYGTYESVIQVVNGNEAVFNTFAGGYIGSNYITRSTTSIRFDGGGPAFDAGQIQVYGVK
jgi:hypothetical protein